MECAYYECMYLCVCAQSLSCVQLFTASQTVVQQAPLFMEFSQPKYWSRLPFSTPEDLPNPGIKPTCLMSPALAGGFFITSTTWEAHIMNMYIYCFLNNFYAKAVRLLVTCFRTPKPNNIFWTSFYVINHLSTNNFKQIYAITLYRATIIYYTNPYL